jgi:hypothetical protein
MSEQMSEQMSVSEYAIKLSNGGICNDLGCPECRGERLRMKARILADRKATVQRCKTALSPLVDSSREYNKYCNALDGVLEETK